MARNDGVYTTICPLAYTNIEVHYGDQYFHTTYCKIDDFGNCLGTGEACLYNNQAQDVCAGVVGGYEFGNWQFTDHDGCCQCPNDNPVSLLTDQTE